MPGDEPVGPGRLSEQRRAERECFDPENLLRDTQQPPVVSEARHGSIQHQVPDAGAAAVVDRQVHA
jgi:hypothetical protein